MSPTTSWGEAGTHMDTSPRQDGRGLLRPQPPRKERVLGNNRADTDPEFRAKSHPPSRASPQPSVRDAPRGWQIALRCDIVAPSAAQVSLESARLCISSSALPTIISRSNFSLLFPLWNILSRSRLHGWACGSEKGGRRNQFRAQCLEYLHKLYIEVVNVSKSMQCANHDISILIFQENLVFFLTILFCLNLLFCHFIHKV